MMEDVTEPSRDAELGFAVRVHFNYHRIYIPNCPRAGLDLKVVPHRLAVDHVPGVFPLFERGVHSLRLGHNSPWRIVAW